MSTCWTAAPISAQATSSSFSAEMPCACSALLEVERRKSKDERVRKSLGSYFCLPTSDFRLQAQPTCLRRFVRFELTLEHGDLVLQEELAFLEALQLDLIL